MGVYAVTGAASGIGAAIASDLRCAGHKVITIDLHKADIECDLGTPAGRELAISAVLHEAGCGLDGLVTCAGILPKSGELELVPSVNYFGSICMVRGLKDCLAKRRGSVVLLSSNSATMFQLDQTYQQAFVEEDEQKARVRVVSLEGNIAYAGSKHAIACWVRRTSTEFLKVGVRMNAIAPGFTDTPMSQQVLGDVHFEESTRSLIESIPLGRIGKTSDQSAAAVFLLGENASYISGAVLFVDGGYDAMLRPDLI